MIADANVELGETLDEARVPVVDDSDVIAKADVGLRRKPVEAWIAFAEEGEDTIEGVGREAVLAAELTDEDCIFDKDDD